MHFWFIKIDLMVKCEWSESEFVAGKNMYGFSLVIYKNIDETVRCQRLFFFQLLIFLG